MTLARWTSLLFVPAHSEKHVKSALRLRPEAVILDLEDGVATADKPAARAMLHQWQQLLAEADLPCLIRVNSDAALLKLDIAAVNFKALAGIVVPKCVSRQSLHPASDFRGSGLIALIESPAAIQNLSDIAELKSVQGLMFGPEDYAREMGISPHARAIEHAAALVAIAASAAGKPAYGLAGSLANFSDLQKFRQDAELTRDLGFSGALAIHPAQLPFVKNAFAPTEGELAWASKVVAAEKDNQSGAFKLDGQMIDVPIVQQARKILQRAKKPRQL